MNNTTRTTRARKIVRFISIALLVILAMLMFTSANAKQALAITAAEKQAEADAASARLAETEQVKAKDDEDFNTAIMTHGEAEAALNDAKERAKAAEEKIAQAKERLENSTSQTKSDGEIAFLETLFGGTSLKPLDAKRSFSEAVIKENEKIIQDNKAEDFKAEIERIEHTLQEMTAHEREANAEAVKIKDEELVSQQKAEADALSTEAADLAKVEAAGMAVVNAAASKLGVPYVWGATGPNTFDCSGLTSWSYQQAGRGWIGRTDADQYANAKERFPYSSGKAQPGDILWWPGHVGIYAGNGQYINAPQTGDVVKYSNYRIDTATVLRF